MHRENMETIIEQFQKVLSAQADLRLFAILDPARNRNIHIQMVKMCKTYKCLYPGDMPLILSETAPYMVRIKPDDPFLTWLLQEGWGQSWGVFFISPTPLEKSVTHFRRFLQVKDEEDKTLYFRFYDPRVLRIYLPTCDPYESRFIFGSVKYFFLEGEDGVDLIRFSYNNSMLSSQVTAVY